MGGQLIQTYPPENWICPDCGHEHSKPHYSVPGQIDYTKKPGKSGRILFNRRDKNDELATDTPIDQSKPMKGEPKEDGIERPLFCPHCGFETDATILIRVGELPSKIDRFFQEEGIDPKKSWRKLLNDFVNWLKKREDGL